MPPPEFSLAELMVQRWTIEDGLPSDVILDVVRSEDGYLWIASYEGLIRFDGQSFEVFNRKSVPELQNNVILDLVEGRDHRLWLGLQQEGIATYSDGEFEHLVADWDGLNRVSAILPETSAVWIGTAERGAFHWAEGELKPFESPALDGMTIRDIFRDRGGVLWFATEENGLVGYHADGSLRIFTKANGLASNSVFSVVEVAEGVLAAGTMKGLSFLRSDDVVNPPDLRDLVINQIRLDQHGHLWMATSGGLFRKNLATGESESLSSFDGALSVSLASIFFGQEGEVWLGSDAHGLIQLQAPKFQTYQTPMEIAGGIANVIFQTDTDQYLVGGDDGRIFWIHEENGESLLTPMALQSNTRRARVRDVMRDHRGALWFATSAGLLVVGQDGEAVYDMEDGLPTDKFRSLHKDKAGVTWVGTRDRGLLKFESPRDYQLVGRSEGLSSNFILDINEDLEGNLLVGTKFGFNIVHSAGRIDVVTMEDGLAGNLVFSVSADERGAIWACTSGGLSRWKNGQVRNITMANGLPTESCFDFEEDDEGGLWISSSFGAIRLDQAATNALLDGGTSELIEARLFDDRDGMSHRQSTGSSKILKADDGRLWFPTLDGVSIIDPRDIRLNKIPPPVHISEFVVDGESIGSSQEPLRIKPGRRDFSLRFAALSLLAPSKVEVRYRLHGFDSDWIEAHHRRTVRYTNLAPGDYEFQVEAANNDGEWNDETVSLEFKVLPRFYQTPAFRWGLGLLGTWGFVQIFNRWRRSVPAVAANLYRELAVVEPRGLIDFLSHRVYRLESVSGAAILNRVSALSMGGESPVAELKAQLIHLLSVLFDRTCSARTSLDRAAWKDMADVLMQQAMVWDAFAEVYELEGGQAQKVVKAIANQDRLLASIFRSESLAHLTAIQDDLVHLWALPEIEHLFHPEFLNHLVEVWGDLDQVHRLASPEDRTLFLARALTKALALKEMLEVAGGPNPSVDLETKLLALECLRQLVTRELQGVHHQAELSIELNSRVLTAYREAVVTLTIKNLGQGPARGLLIELMPSEESFRTIQNRQQVKSLLKQQAARVEFLVEPKVSDRVRLKFRITYDDLESQGHQHEFADIVEFRQVPVRSTFRPLRPNPYVIGRPLLESDVFIGREEIFARLRASLQGVHQDNVLVIMGPRRMGKTSILRRLRLHLDERYVPILIDLQGMIGNGEPAFFRELVATIGDELEELGVEVSLPRRGAFDHEPGTVFRRQFLRKVREVLGDRRLLLIFDEFEVLEERIRSGDLKPQILPYFRSLMQHEEKISFIFAGTHRLDELTRDYWGVLFNLAVYLDVGHLSEKEIHQLFLKPMEGFFEIDPLALDKVFQITGGHPHFSQLLARELVEFRNRNKISYVTIQDVNQIAERVAEKGQLHISYLWEDGSSMERQLLRILKDLLDRRGIATFNAVQRQMNELGVANKEIGVALKQLMRREILQDNAGLLSFRIDLLRLWLDREPDLGSSREVPIMAAGKVAEEDANA